MSTLLTIIWILSIAWIGYRILIAKQFLLWDWSDGKFEYMWDKERDEEEYPRY